MKEAVERSGLVGSETYTENPLINEILPYLDSWRTLRNPADWGVSGPTQRLLDHWPHHNFVGPRPFFCQLEAVETIVTDHPVPWPSAGTCSTSGRVTVLIITLVGKFGVAAPQPASSPSTRH